MTPPAGWRDVDAVEPKPTSPCSCGASSPGLWPPTQRWCCRVCGRLLPRAPGQLALPVVIADPPRAV